MGALVAVIDKSGRSAVENALAMLGTLRHRFEYSYGVATENSVFIAKAEGKIKDEVSEASAAIGYGLCKIKSNDESQPILGEKFAFALEGRFFPPQDPSDLEFAVKLLKKNPRKESEELVKKLDGSYNFAVLYNGQIIVGRDPFGTRALYYGENSRFAAIASEIKALRTLGMEDVKSFPPGNLAVIGKYGFTFKKVRRFVDKTLNIDEKEAVSILQRLLLNSVRERIEDLESFGLAFSGGVDSGTLALLSKKCGANPRLICVGLKEGKEIQEAVSAAEKLNLPIKVEIFSEEDVENAIPKVLWIIEEPDPLKLSIAIPMYFAARTAKRNGLKVLLAGQGSDELFVGYKKYLEIYSEKGEDALQEVLRADFLNCYKTNFERDEKICAFHKIELRLPFADWELANFVLGLPVKFKASLKGAPQRKIILRKTAEKLGLPDSIAYKPKKAIQYATGVSNLLRRIAKREGLSLRSYVEKVFNEICLNRRGYEENSDYL